MNARISRPCQGKKKGGAPCGAYAAAGSLYCFLHDPEREEERRAWSRKGGKARSTQQRLSRLIRDAEELTTNDLKRLLSGAMLLMLEGTLDPSHLSALSAAARTLEGIRTATEIQVRIDALETALNGPQRRFGA